MTRKGKIEEIISRAKYADELARYSVGYRDFEKIKEVSLLDFLTESDNFNIIPMSRIRWIKKDNKILFQKIGR